MAFKCKIQIYLLVVDPGRPQSLLKLGQTHDVDVYKLYHFIALCGAAGFVSHNLSHDPVEKRKTTTLIQQIDPHVKLVSRQPLHLILLGRPLIKAKHVYNRERNLSNSGLRIVIWFGNFVLPSSSSSSSL